MQDENMYHKKYTDHYDDRIYLYIYGKYIISNKFFFFVSKLFIRQTLK
jgi:hypothetical protein